MLKFSKCQKNNYNTPTYISLTNTQNKDNIYYSLEFINDTKMHHENLKIQLGGSPWPPLNGLHVAQIANGNKEA